MRHRQRAAFVCLLRCVENSWMGCCGECWKRRPNGDLRNGRCASCRCICAPGRPTPTAWSAGAVSQPGRHLPDNHRYRSVNVEENCCSSLLAAFRGGSFAHSGHPLSVRCRSCTNRGFCRCRKKRVEQSEFLAHPDKSSVHFHLMRVVKSIVPVKSHLVFTSV